jgi:hypothetical protein
MAVVAVDGHIPSEDLLIGKNLDLMRLAGLQLEEYFVAPLRPHLLRIGAQKCWLDDHTALHSRILLHQVPHCPLVHATVSCQLPHPLLRIFSHSCLNCDDSPDRSLIAPWPWHQVPGVIFLILKIRLLLTPRHTQILVWCFPLGASDQ